METLRFLMVSTFYPPYHLGGDAIMVENLANELTKRGHEVHLFYEPAAYALLRGYARLRDRQVSEDEVHRHEYAPRMGRFAPILASSLGVARGAEIKLEALAADTKPDVVHYHNVAGFLRKPAGDLGSVNLYTAHDFFSICPRTNLVRPNTVACTSARWCQICLVRWRRPPQPWRIGSRRVLRYSDNLELLSPSEFLAKRFSEEGIAVDHVLRNFVPDSGKHRQRTQFPHDSIVYLGMLEPHKGILDLVRAFARSSSSQGFALWVIGEGSLKQKLIETAKALGVSERIRFCGHLSRNEWEQIVLQSSSLVIPSRCPENAPLSAMEALSLGVPVVGSRSGGLPEVIESIPGSALFNPGDIEELSRILISRWLGRSESGTEDKEARRTFEMRFHPDIHIKEYLKIIQEASN